MEVPATISCVECGGTAHRVSYEPHEGFEPGQIVAYACEDCSHRMDLVLDETDGEA
jgi:hypothetical protein